MTTGGTNEITVDATYSHASGFRSSARREVQLTYASGSFTEPANETSLTSVGEAQSKLIVFRGEIPGNAPGESDQMHYGRVPLGLTLEEGKAYTLEAKIVASAIVGGVDATAEMKRTCIATMRGGVATIIAQSSLEIVGDAVAVANWTFSFTTPGVPIDYVALVFGSGASTAWARVVASLGMISTIFPDV